MKTVHVFLQANADFLIHKNTHLKEIVGHLESDV